MVLKNELGNNPDLHGFERGFRRSYEKGLTKSLTQTFHKRELSKTIGLIIAMGLISIAVSLLYLFLLQQFTRAVIYASLIIILLFLLTVVIGCFISGHFLAGFLLAVVLALFACMFFVLRSTLEAVIIITRLTT